MKDQCAGRPTWVNSSTNSLSLTFLLREEHWTLNNSSMLAVLYIALFETETIKITTILYIVTDFTRGFEFHSQLGKKKVTNILRHHDDLTKCSGPFR